MEDKDLLIKDLLKQRRNILRQIESANFKGYPEVKEINGKKYIYLRYKKYNRLSSTYAGIYTDELFNSLKDMSNNIRELNYKLRSINYELAKLGVNSGPLDYQIILNREFIRNNLNNIIYGQAVVEGIAATFLDTKEIIENGKSNNVSFDDTLKILNLKNAWSYVLDEDTIRRGISFSVLSDIVRFINDRLTSYGEQIRSTDVFINGSSYRPPLPNRNDIEYNIKNITSNNNDEIVNNAIELLLYISKAQIFYDGNKRIAVIFANFYLLLNHQGFIYIPSKLDTKYKNLLVEYYEGKNNKVKKLILNECYFPLR